MPAEIVFDVDVDTFVEDGIESERRAKQAWVNSPGVGAFGATEKGRMQRFNGGRDLSERVLPGDASTVRRERPHDEGPGKAAIKIFCVDILKAFIRPKAFPFVKCFRNHEARIAEFLGKHWLFHDNDHLFVTPNYMLQKALAIVQWREKGCSVMAGAITVASVP